MAFYTYQQIEGKLTEIINHYFSDGYKVSLRTAFGSYYKISFFMDFTKSSKPIPDEFIRIWYKDEYDYDLPCKRLTITAEKFVTRNNSIGYHYPGEGTIIEQYMFYCVKEPVDCRKPSVFVDSLNEFKSVKDKKDKRRAIKKEDTSVCKSIALESLSNDTIDHIMHRINSRRGFSKATSLCISSITFSFDRENNPNDHIAYRAKIDFSYNGRYDTIYLHSMKSNWQRVH